MAKAKRGNVRAKSSVVMERSADSSDDDGPEEVAFNESKAEALARVKAAQDSVKREKELQKEKRRKRQLLFQEQKKNRRLPETVLEEFDTAGQDRQNSSDKKDGEKSEEEEDEEEEQVEVKKSKKVGKSLQGNCSVMRVRDESSELSLQKTAMDFVHNRLYGQGSRRMTSTEFLSLEKKRGPNQGAAVQFVNKNLGAKRKAKA